VGTDDEPPEVVADRVLAAWSAERVAVPLGARTYTARFEDGASGAALAAAAAELAPTSIVLVTDSNVAPLWAAPAEAALARVARTARVVLPAGEAHKRLGTVEAALAEMLAAGADRRSVVVSLGGGVASDMAGFAAAVFLRGVRWVCAPTTLLAMVDASIGGKTGVDLGDAKNAVGAFHQPSAVVVDAAYTATQAERDYTSGLAEVVKTACVGDAALLDRLEAEVDALRARRLDVVRGVALRCVRVKAAIVGRDEREAGERAVLNFGHTLGHALEADGGFEALTHGEAVSLGVVAALRVGVRRGVTEAALADRVTRLLAGLGLPTALAPAQVGRAVRLIELDKKRVGRQIRAILMRAPGDVELTPIDVDELTRGFVDAANFAPAPARPLD
jgi:shikimate kinase/3-dehydroquinate synthase